LPDFLFLGIPEVLPLDPEVFAYDSKGDSITCEMVADSVGFKFRVDNPMLNANRFHREFNDFPFSCCNSTQVVSFLKGSFDLPDLALPSPCSLDAPVEANGFPDGSLTNPLHPKYGLGGAGVFLAEQES